MKSTKINIFLLFNWLSAKEIDRLHLVTYLIVSICTALEENLMISTWIPTKITKMKNVKNEHKNWSLMRLTAKFVYLVNLIDLRRTDAFRCWFYVNTPNVNKGFNNRSNTVVKNQGDVSGLRASGVDRNKLEGA